MKQVKETLIIMTNLEGKKSVTIKYQYYGISDIDVSPDEIIISTKYLQPDPKRIITVESNNDLTFELINPRIVNGENIELTITDIVPGKQIELVLFFKEEFIFQENVSPTVSFGVKSEKGETVYTIPIKDLDKL